MPAARAAMRYRAVGETEMTTRHVPVLIIGSGPAGYTAAIYAARAMLKPVLIAGLEQGGQLMITTDVENYPGYADPVQGPWMMEQMLKQAENVGAEIVNDLVTEVDVSTRPFQRDDRFRHRYTPPMRSSWRPAPRPNGSASRRKQTFMGFGVSACATCDGFFYRGKDVIVVGGGNTAVEEALYLVQHRPFGDAGASPRRSCAPNASCRKGSSTARTSRWCGTASSTRSPARRPGRRCLHPSPASG